MANEIIKYLRDWGLDKIFTITVDNASSNDVTVKELSKIFTKRAINFMNGEHLHVRCMTHILNLVVQDGLKVSVVSIERVRKAVKYIRLSPVRYGKGGDGRAVGALLSDDWDNSISKDKGSPSSSLSSSSFENSGSLLSKLQKYLAEENEVERKNFNILSCWKINSTRFFVLAEMARDVLVIPISSVASVCAFSTGGRILDSFRSSLTPKLVQTLMCLQDWIRSESRPISVEEDIDVLEQLEKVRIF
ncbi:hypothetical protein KY290_031215 [Solanum tuberosum]|uniref:HAT C-terminal dimerisation domain-containing protein n=1 Tax=Solanum tuberosum TaxID=4113 RepID=A0ABQ7UAB0_SOLTU|nr:hypothetical protein KY290_031215 [Solanum tuberosum]